MLLVMIVADCFGFGFGLIEWLIDAGSLDTTMLLIYFKAMMMPVLLLIVFEFLVFEFESKIAVVTFSVWLCFGILLWIFRSTCLILV